jgi:AraC family transcriptional regulator of adaptative response / methylphosphotriester-DNA alkyltransferase methyltransferase
VLGEPLSHLRQSWRSGVRMAVREGSSAPRSDSGSLQSPRETTLTPSLQPLTQCPVSVDRAERLPPIGSVPSSAVARRPARFAGTRSSRASLFRDAQAIIQRDYGEDVAVDALAQRVLASRRQLQRAFTDAGTSVRAELGAVRMRHAAALLSGSSLSVRAIASRVGYRQPAHFANSFRRRHGVTPSQYRQEVVLRADFQGGCFPPSRSRTATSSSASRQPTRGEVRWLRSAASASPKTGDVSGIA